MTTPLVIPKIKCSRCGETLDVSRVQWHPAGRRAKFDIEVHGHDCLVQERPKDPRYKRAGDDVADDPLSTTVAQEKAKIAVSPCHIQGGTHL